MSRTVTALYDTRAEAEAARERLASEVDLGSARIIDQDSHASGQPDGSLDQVGVSPEDRGAFDEGLRRGGFMLVAEVRGHEDADRIIGLLEETPSVDLEERQQAWRGEGWSPQGGAVAPGGSASAFGTGTVLPGTSQHATNAQPVSEERIPVIEEQLVVGKREVERGGARIRSYVRDVPVEQDVTLHQEQVHVQRRPVNQRIEPGQVEGVDLFEERTVEFTAMAEEPVVSKEARVREEVVVRKSAEEHVEQIDSSVSRTEVEVEPINRTDTDRSAFGGFGEDPDRRR